MRKHPFEEHIPNLRRYALALLRERALADDLVQDTLERALTKFALFRDRTNLRAWLFTIMHNTFINQWHKTSSNKRHAETDAAGVAMADTADEMITAHDMLQALEQLSIEQRTVLLLVGLEQLSYEQAARVLDVPPGTVMSRLARARERLQVLMNGEALPRVRRVK